MVAVTQATNNNSSLGYAIQRPNRISDPNQFDGRSVAKYFNTAAFTPAAQFVIGTSSRNPVRGPGLQNADLMNRKDVSHHGAGDNLEFRAEAFNVSNTPPFERSKWKLQTRQPRCLGRSPARGNPRDFEFVAKVHFLNQPAIRRYNVRVVMYTRRSLLLGLLCSRAAAGTGHAGNCPSHWRRQAGTHSFRRRSREDCLGQRFAS